jgi:hypothetical protein
MFSGKTLSKARTLSEVKDISGNATTSYSVNKARRP